MFRSLCCNHQDGNKLLNELMDYADPKSEFVVDFVLERDGDCRMTTTVYRQGGGRPTFADDNLEHMAHIVCSQAFFFLKDITHTHQHHDPKTDTMTDVYPIYDPDDDKTWRSETLRNLYRRILDFKRLRTEKVYSSAHGILCYAKSFKLISTKKLEKGGGNSELKPDLFDDLLAESIDASQRSSENTNQLSLRRSELLRTLAISILTVVLSLVSVLRLTDQPKIHVGDVHWVFGWLVEHIVSSPFTFIGLVVLFVVGILNVTKAIDVANNSFATTYYLILQALYKSQTKAFVSGLLGSVLVFDVSLWFSTGNSLILGILDRIIVYANLFLEFFHISSG